MYEKKGQMVDAITLHKENDSDGWPWWPDESRGRGPAPCTKVAFAC